MMPTESWSPCREISAGSGFKGDKSDGGLSVGDKVSVPEDGVDEVSVGLRAWLRDEKDECCSGASSS
jgi:hypothetical protein